MIILIGTCIDSHETLICYCSNNRKKKLVIYQLLYTFLSLSQLLTGHGSNGKLRDDEIMTMQEIRGGKSDRRSLGVCLNSFIVSGNQKV